MEKEEAQQHSVALTMALCYKSVEATLAGNYKMGTALCNILTAWNKAAH